MNGLLLTTQLRQLLSESSTSDWIDSKTSYDYLYEAACVLNGELALITNSQDITTVANQTEYNLNYDFMSLYLTDDEDETFLKYNDGTNDFFVKQRDYNRIILANDTTATSVPDNFAIRDERTQASMITGVCDGNGSNVGDRSTLYDTAATFLTTVQPGDGISNLTDGSYGIITELIDNNYVYTSLFYGTANDWSTNDNYYITPQTGKVLILSQPSLTAGHTITIEYIQKPRPVYSYYTSYRFDSVYAPLLVKYAAWLYKYRDREPSYADALYMHWREQIRRHKYLARKVRGTPTWRVNFKKRSNHDRSYR